MESRTQAPRLQTATPSPVVPKRVGVLAGANTPTSAVTKNVVKGPHVQAFDTEMQGPLGWTYDTDIIVRYLWVRPWEEAQVRKGVRWLLGNPASTDGNIDGESSPFTGNGAADVPSALLATGTCLAQYAIDERNNAPGARQNVPVILPTDDGRWILDETPNKNTKHLTGISSCFSYCVGTRIDWLLGQINKTSGAYIYVVYNPGPYQNNDPDQPPPPTNVLYPVWLEKHREWQAARDYLTALGHTPHRLVLTQNNTLSLNGGPQPDGILTLGDAYTFLRRAAIQAFAGNTPVIYEHGDLVNLTTNPNGQSFGPDMTVMYTAAADCLDDLLRNNNVRNPAKSSPKFHH